MLAPGLAFIVLAAFVRRGGLPSIIISVVLIVVMLIGSILPLFDPTGVAPGLCFTALVIVALGTLLAMLIAAARASGRVTAARQQYQAQYWQYQQNMQAYGTGYGYGQPQPGMYPPGYQPAAPPPPPPPTGATGNPPGAPGES